MTASPLSGAPPRALARAPGGTAELPGAHDVDRILARARSENFPVASRLLPAAQREHLLAIYAFARWADELGDEAPGDRLAWIDGLARELDRVYAGVPRTPVGRRLAATVRACGLPREPFEKLLEANRVDQRVTRHPTFASLEAYCELSANPVGRLVLHVFGAATPERFALSDRVCTALQVAEHCQDVAEDRALGRVYLPREDLARFGVVESDLAAPAARPAVRDLLRLQVNRARAALDAGPPLVASLSGRARLAVAGFVAGGHAALDDIVRRRFDVLAHRCRPRRRDLVRRFAGVLRAAS